MRHLDEQLEILRNKLLEMGDLVQAAVRESVGTVEAGRAPDTQSFSRREEQINRLELEIDEVATKLIALEQPVAGDLRFLAAAGRMGSNLERIGDLAENVADRSKFLAQEPRPPIHTDIPKLAELAVSMVQRALEAFVDRDAAKARAVLLADDAVDSVRDAIFAELIQEMKQSSAAVSASVSRMLAARDLERIADHATNLAEAVIYMVEGAEVRHHHATAV